jgi:hypothetical protein
MLRGYDSLPDGVRGLSVDGADYELVAQQLSAVSQKLADLEERVSEAEKVNARLEAAALTTSRALEDIAHHWSQISQHWSGVYEAMRREEQAPELSDVLGEGIGVRPPEPADNA